MVQYVEGLCPESECLLFADVERFVQGEVKLESGGPAQGVESETPIAELRCGGLVVERGAVQPLQGVQVLNVRIYARHKVGTLEPCRPDPSLVNPGENIEREPGALGLDSLNIPSGQEDSCQLRPTRQAWQSIGNNDRLSVAKVADLGTVRVRNIVRI